MKITKLIFAMTAAVASFQALSWGQTGHRVTGAIAEQYLTPKTQAAINALLPNEDLAEASTYADEMRAHSSEFWKKTANPWHYVNVYAGKTYNQSSAPEEGDAITALAEFSKQLQSSKTSIEDKQLALRFIVHIIGDLHQPFHSGTDKDRGGNTVKVNFFYQDTNIHSVWDSGLIDRQKLSYTEWTNKLSRKISAAQAKLWMVTNPEVWVAESAKLRLNAYPKEEKISWSYQYQHIPTIQRRLQMGGVRIAAYLNNILK